MGRKIFVSYKFADNNVYNWASPYNLTVRDYVDHIEKKLNYDDHIYKGESDGEDLSYLNEATIWGKLRDRIYDSSMTLIMISPNMKTSIAEKNQWIPREISYSLKETSRINKNGDPITSRTSALLAVALPDRNNSYSYAITDNYCCQNQCRTFHTDSFFRIIANNMFNTKNPNRLSCNNGRNILSGNYSYIHCVKWDEFSNDINHHIDKAYQINSNIDMYNVCKEVI